jgi:hypothetical protein
MTDQEKVTAFWNTWKTKKNLIEQKINGSFFNHPNRTSAFSTSGSMSLVRDQRVTTSTPSVGATAQRAELSVDFSVISGFNRFFVDVPIARVESLNEMPAGNFAMLHLPCRPWTFEWFAINYAESPNLVGTILSTFYEYTSSGWVVTDSETFDVFGVSGFTVDYGGGYFVEEGFFFNGGYSEESEDYKATINCIASLTAPDYPYPAFPFPYLASTGKRWPWDDSWGSITDGLADSFADFLADQNSFNPGQWSGSLTLAYNFS